MCTVYVSISHVSLAAMPPSESLSQWKPGISFHLRAEGRALVAHAHTHTHTHTHTHIHIGGPEGGPVTEPPAKGAGPITLLG